MYEHQKTSLNISLADLSDITDITTKLKVSPSAPICAVCG
jgi:hypothetical protein